LLHQPRESPPTSILLTTIMRSRRRFADQSIMRALIISMPVLALITTAAVSTASRAVIDWPTKSL